MKKFTRHGHHRKKRLKPRWRRPKGLHNKQRLEHKGSTPRVKKGYRSPKETRGKKNGLEIVNVYNLKDIASIDKKTQGVVVGNVGMKKKILLLEEIQKQGLTLLTGDAEKQAQALKDRWEEKKQSREEKRQEREERQQELEESVEEQEADDEPTPLSKVKGVGPSRIEKLEEAGVSSAEQLADFTPAELAEQSEVSETVAKKLIDAAKKTLEADEDEEKEKVLTKAR